MTLSLSEKDSWVIFTVTDTGIGVDEADLDLIFGRFHRGRNATEYPGNGLGLAITHNIFETHGGRLEVESVPVRTQVKMKLPLKIYS